MLDTNRRVFCWLPVHILSKNGSANTRLTVILASERKIHIYVFCLNRQVRK